ncbi:MULTISPECIES: DNA methyltransferase [unclassified Microcoleus]|uniref:DNA methyltransferase n=1 Tax=unclassified Microcoleus TaxID=2642155 RepID=UPI002FD0897B
MPATPESLQKFVTYCQQHITGDEKGQAQVFLDRFFQAFGHDGALEAGATYEERIEKSSKKGQMGFADLVWKKHVLIEMKKRGEDLTKREHRTQTERYYIRLKKDDRPRYVMMCNFDEFHIYDFDLQPDQPVDIISLKQLPARSPAFAFMESTSRRPIFKNNQVEITEKAASRMGMLLEMLIDRGKERKFAKFNQFQAQRFVLQCVLAMFAEDRGLLPSALFTRCVKDCLEGASSYDVLGGLFQAMNQQGVTPAGRYEGVEYFNGGLFSEIHPIELQQGELKILEVCAEQNWSQVRPSIFGNIFESALKTDKKQRRAYGIHFTTEGDIRRIVLPTISYYWEERINAANTVAKLQNLHQELGRYRVLDPACGSGNFLYVAYQELKQVEKLLLDKLNEFDGTRGYMNLVTPQQFYGMDINSFAVELARVTLMIGRKVAIDNLGLKEPSLPLDTLDKNIVCADALFTDWVKADAIIGNPPFLGGKHMRIALGDEYIDRVFKRFPDVKDSVDFCAYWFRIAHNNLELNGRAGLVATNSISQGKSRAAALDYVAQNSGHIYAAVSTQPWSGEAKVHVSLINWSKEKQKVYYLDNLVVSSINSSLQATIDVSQSSRLLANLNKCFQGVIPVGMGFIVTQQQVNDWIKANAKNQEVIKLFSMGANLAKTPNCKPERWIIDFNDMSMEEASNYELPLQHIRIHVKPEREQNREAILREKWWRFKRTNQGMRKAIAPLSHYFTVPRVSKWAIFIPAPVSWLPGDKSVVVASEDFYILGILSSNIHRIWMHAQKSTLKGDIAYTHNTCFETFPFPQTPTRKSVEQIRATAVELHQYRTQQMSAKQWGITQLYNKFFEEPTSQLYKLHEALDRECNAAYGFTDSDDILAKVLELNLEVAEKEKRGEPVVGACVPTDYKY